MDRPPGPPKIDKKATEKLIRSQLLYNSNCLRSCKLSLLRVNVCETVHVLLLAPACLCMLAVLVHPRGVVTNLVPKEEAGHVGFANVVIR